MGTLVGKFIDDLSVDLDLFLDGWIDEYQGLMKSIEDRSANEPIELKTILRFCRLRRLIEIGLGEKMSEEAFGSCEIKDGIRDIRGTLHELKISFGEVAPDVLKEANAELKELKGKEITGKAVTLSGRLCIAFFDSTFDHPGSKIVVVDRELIIL